MNPSQDPNTSQNNPQPQMPVQPQASDVPQPDIQPVRSPSETPQVANGTPTEPHQKRQLSKYVLVTASLVGVIVVAIMLLVLSQGSSAKSWRQKNDAQFQSSGKKVTNDIVTISGDVQNQDTTALSTDCQELKTDLVTLQAIPAFPVKTTNDKLVDAERSVAKGADDCLSAVSGQDGSLLNQAGQEVDAGVNGLKAVIPAING